MRFSRSCYIYKTRLIIFVCGDFNINYLSENNKRKQLDAMSILYNLTSAVDSPYEFRINPVQQLTAFI